MSGLPVLVIKLHRGFGMSEKSIQFVSGADQIVLLSEFKKDVCFSPHSV